MKQIILFFSIVYFSLYSPGIGVAASNGEELYTQGQDAAARGETDEAIKYFEKAIESDPDLPAPYNALALTYLDRQGNYDDIIWLFQQAADRDPQNPEIYANMCRAYFQYEKFDWAESSCLKALTLNKDYGPAKMTLAYVYLLGKSQPALAVKYFTQILERVQSPKIYFALGLAYAKNNEQAKTLEVITLLRGMGEETLATQLEKMIRPSGEPPSPLPSTVTKNEPNPLEYSIPNISEPVHNNVSISSSQPGSTRIKLKGKLSMMAVNPDAKTPSRSHAGQKKDDSENISNPPEESAVERIKKMRGGGGAVRVRGNSTVSVQGTAAATTP